MAALPLPAKQMRQGRKTTKNVRNKRGGELWRTRRECKQRNGTVE
jgi:hypothetical protein